MHLKSLGLELSVHIGRKSSASEVKFTPMEIKDHQGTLITHAPDSNDFSYLQLDIKNTHPAQSYEQMRKSHISRYGEWKSEAWEKREGCIVVLPDWMENPFWQVGSDPLGLALHGGQAAQVTHLNKDTRLSRIFHSGQINMKVFRAELTDLNVEKWIEFNRDGRSIRFKPQEETSVAFLCHQKPQSDKLDSPDYWKPFFSHGQGAHLFNVRPSSHGRVLTMGSRNDERVHFVKDDITFRLLSLKLKHVGDVKLMMK